MNRVSRICVLITGVLATGCSEAVPTPDGGLVASVERVDDGRHTIVVNPNASGNGIAATIQEGLDRVVSGGRVLVTAGTYNGGIVINKAVTLEAIGNGGEAAVLEQTVLGGGPVIQLLTSQGVLIRGLAIHHVNGVGIAARPVGGADLTLDRMTILGSWTLPPPITGSGVVMSHNTVQSGGRSRLVVRSSRFNGVSAGLRLFGDVDVLVERNVFSFRTSCLVISPTGTGGGTVPAGAFTNVDIVNNEFAECGSDGPGLDGNGIRVEGTVGATTGGSVNIIGNIFRSSRRVVGDCNATAILYEFYSGRIEHNSFNNVVQDCAAPTARSLPAAIFVGSRTAGMPPANPVVRFNDIAGNAQAGLRIAPNITTPLNAPCNWWGSASGPTAAAWPAGTGDAIVVEPGAATPAFTPFAPAPIAESRATSC